MLAVITKVTELQAPLQMDILLSLP